MHIRWGARRWGWTAALSALTLVSCTTVTRSALVTSSGSALPGVATGQSGTGPQGVAAAVDGSTPGAPSPTPGSGQGTAVTGPLTLAGPGGAATGTTGCSKPVKIGVSYSSDEAAGLAIVGNSGASSQQGSYVQQQQAVFQRAADDLNSHGGLAGCKVVLGYHDFKSLASDGFSGESENECVDFAEDQKVFAVINTTLENRTLTSCLAQHRVIDLYYGATYQATPADFSSYRGYLYEPSTINPYRWAPFIDQLASAGYFPHGARVGILLADDGTGTNQYLVNTVWKPKLAALGITPVVFTYTQIEGFSDVSGTTSQFSSAVLQFKEAGVDHVMATPDNGDATVFFTQVAQSQNYHPRYALTSASGPAAWGTEPAGQRPGAMNVSYGFLDFGLAPSSQLATAAPSPARTRCEALFKGHTGASSIATAFSICDAFNFLAAALSGAPAATPAAVLSGAEHLGTSFSLADGYANASFGPPNHYDGGAATRVMAWNEAAQTWQFATPATPVP